MSSISHNSTSIIIKFGTSSTEANFDAYKIFYKVGDNGVDENDSEWNKVNDGNLDDIDFYTATTTTITGLSIGTEYVFNIWAYDMAGNKNKALSELVANTNHAPGSVSLLSQLKNDEITNINNNQWTDENQIKLKAEVNDNDLDEVLSLYFELIEDGNTFKTATSVPSGACASGVDYETCTSKVWYADSVEGDYSVSTYSDIVQITILPNSATGSKWQVIACDSHDLCSDNWTLFNAITPNFKVDNVLPASPGDLTEYSKTNTSVTLDLSTTSTESNFNEYIIYYKVGTSSVTENDLEFSSSSDIHLKHRDYQGASTTIIDNLSADTDYVFNIWAYDLAGNKASAMNEVTVKTNSSSNRPTGIFNSVTQDTDGSGRMNISIEVDDSDNDDTLRAKLEYEAGSTCNFSSSSSPTLDELDVNITADHGDPDIDNQSDYQVGTSTNWILTSPGSNTINFDWLSKTDIPLADGTYCLRLTVNDGLLDQLVSATTTVSVYNLAPTDPGALTLSEKSTYDLTLYFGSSTVSSNFSEYKIFYKEGSFGVSETDTEHSDSNLSNINYGGESTTTISGLSAGTEYVFNIWAYDIYGNKASPTEFATTTNYIPASPSSLDQLKNDGLTSIVNGEWTEENNVKLKASVNDSDASEILTLYFELLESSGTATTSTSTPSGACSASASYASCGSKIWSVSSSLGDYSVTPFIGEVNPTLIPDSSDGYGYKWQVMACDDDVCSDWTGFNVSSPNFKLDNSVPSDPGNLSFHSRTYDSITLNFGATSTESNFTEYKIYYKQGSTGVTEGNELHGSSTDPSLDNILYRGDSTTTISELIENTEYVFNIWVYDEVGNKANASEVSYFTNNRPTGQFISANQKLDGTGRADIVIQVSDTNSNDSKAKLEYVAGLACDFSIPLDPDLDELDNNATSTYGDAKIENNNTYQIGNSAGWIITSSGANNVSFDWLSDNDMSDANGDYCLRLTVNDGADDQTNSATTTLTLDNLEPTAPGDLMLVSRTATKLVLGFGSESVETNFVEYKIFYKEGAATVLETDSELIDDDLSSINYGGTATTSLSGLDPNTQYSFKIFAYDSYGNKSSSGQVASTTKAIPSGGFNSVAQKTNGSGVVDISIEVYDFDGDDVSAKLEYVSGAACNFGSPLDPSLDESAINITADHGTPTILNSSEYQIGTSTRIITSSGANTVNFDWDTATDLPTGDGTYCLRLTVKDDTDIGLVATTTLTVDNVNPEVPGNLADNSVTGLSATLGFGSDSSDSNFSDYKIFYKLGSSGVTELNNEFNEFDDLNLSEYDFNSATETIIGSLVQNSTYVFNIWAYDLYGNKSNAAIEVSTTTISIPTATWRELEDVVDPTSGTYLSKSSHVRVRVVVSNTGDWEASNYEYSLQYGEKDGTCAAVSNWADVLPNATSSHWEMVASDYFLNESLTSKKSTSSEEYNFVPGRMIEAPSATSSGITLGNNDVTEIEYSIQSTASSTSGIAYCFRLMANETVLDNYNAYPEITLAPPPSSIFNSALQKLDGSFVTDISLEIDDVNGDECRVKLEYELGTSCNFSSSTDPTIDTNDINTTADHGDPDIDNDNPYQIGTTSGMIVTSYGPNTVNFDWNSDLDLPGGDATYCLRATVNDGHDDQTIPATTTIVIDQISPDIPGNLTMVELGSNSITLGLGTTTIDTNFREYKIYYKEGSSGVTESNELHASSSDENLGYINFLGATTTLVEDLVTNKVYYFKIWAYDFYGNKSVSEEELEITLRYRAKTENWRWYYDQHNKTPTEAMANEEVAPNTIIAGATTKLRLAMREIEAITGEDIKMRLQYSTYSDFSSDVHYVGESGSTTVFWVYGDGIDNDDDLISTTTLSGLSNGAVHNESGISTSTYDHIGGSLVEWEFTIRNNDAPVSTTYYFRPVDDLNDLPVEHNDGFMYPNLVTGAGAFTYTTTGMGVGSTTEGVVTNISSTPGLIDFGNLTLTNEVIGAHQFEVDTNAGNGYQLFVYSRYDLISNSGDNINPISHSNESPAAWPVAPSPSAFGYHTGDDTLSGINSSRFSANNTYAKFETAMKEISYSQIPVQNEIVDIVYRIEVDSMQEAGDYETEIVYILVPTF